MVVWTIICLSEGILVKIFDPRTLSIYKKEKVFGGRGWKTLTLSYRMCN